MPYFGQDIFLKAVEKGPLTSKEYVEALEKNHRLARADGIDAVMDKLHLDALVAPTGGPAWLIDLVDGDHDTGGSSSPAAVAGYPNINVPLGFVFGMPVGISFFGRAYSEPTLIKLAYAFEQATKPRRAPRLSGYGGPGCVSRERGRLARHLDFASSRHAIDDGKKSENSVATLDVFGMMGDGVRVV